MKAIFFRCDRCRGTVVLPYEVTVDPEVWPSAIRHGLPPRDPRGWEELHDDEKVIDVCPNCITDEERADRLFDEVAAHVLIPLDGEETI